MSDCIYKTIEGEKKRRKKANIMCFWLQGKREELELTNNKTQVIK